MRFSNHRGLKPSDVQVTDLNIETASVDISTRNLYYDLTMLTTGTSLKLVKGVSGNNGLEAYRQLCRRWHAGTRGRNLARLQAISAMELRGDCHRDAG